MEEEENAETKSKEKNESTLSIIKNMINDRLKEFKDVGIDASNLDILYKLIDINKDIENIDYWKIKKEVMTMGYGNYSDGYGNYNEGSYGRRMRDSRGRYMGEYGRRGVDAKYRGSYGHYPEERMEEMKEQYFDYNEGREQYDRGDSYNGEEQMVQATEGIMKNISEIVKEISESGNPQVMQIIQKHAKKMMEM